MAHLYLYPPGLPQTHCSSPAPLGSGLDIDTGYQLFEGESEADQCHPSLDTDETSLQL